MSNNTFQKTKNVHWLRNSVSNTSLTSSPSPRLPFAAGAAAGTGQTRSPVNPVHPPRWSLRWRAPWSRLVLQPWKIERQASDSAGWTPVPSGGPPASPPARLGWAHTSPACHLGNRQRRSWLRRSVISPVTSRSHWRGRTGTTLRPRTKPLHLRARWSRHRDRA